MIPAFSAWIESPEPGMQDEHDGVGDRGTPTSLWPVPTVSRKTVLAGRVEDEQRLQRCLGEAARVPAGAHRADEHAGVEEMVGEADAVAEERALRERARRVDRDHADGLLLARARAATSAEIKLDLPTPGGPVKPTA